MIDKIKLIAQSAIRIEWNNMIIYFDPYKITKEYKNDANIIFITHPHYDHFSKDDILKIKKYNTLIVAPYELEGEIKNIGFKEYLFVEPNKEYKIDNISFNTIPAYNINKDFHKKEYNWVGYIINFDNKKIYVAGDTDKVPEIEKIKCDIAFVPVGGTYTMTATEAVDLINIINPEIAIPIHYKTIVGSDEDAKEFKKLLSDKVDVKILM